MTDRAWEARRSLGLERHMLRAHENIIRNGPEYPGRDSVLAKIAQRAQEIEANPDYHYH